MKTPRQVGRSAPLSLFVVVLLLLVSGTLFTAVNANAYVDNCTAYAPLGNYFVGGHAASSAYFGVSADITVHQPELCKSDQTTSNFNYAWTMITDTANQGHIQSGFLVSYGQAQRHYSQVYNAYNGTLNDVDGSTVAVGEVHQYWQQLSGTTYHSNVDSTQFQTISQATLTYDWAGIGQQFADEIAYKSSDIPGLSTDEMPYSSMQVESASSWVAINSTFLAGQNDCDTRWGGPHMTSQDSMNVWTSDPTGAC
jgi:hypothetical protein